MATVLKNNDQSFSLQIGLKDGREWDKEKISRIKKFIKQESANRTPEQKLKNELLSIQYQMEEYVERHVEKSKQISIDTFLKSFLEALDISFKKFANSIDMNDSNLKKYLTGERRFNTDLALKFGFFFHTSPEIWLKVQMKNELLDLNREKKKVSHYKKYNFENVI